MKKTGLYRLTVLLFALLFCFVSCDGGTTDVPSADSTAAADSMSDGIPRIGAVDLSAFSDELGDDDRLALTQVYAFQPLPELEENWSYSSFQINTYNGLLCLTVERQDERRVTVERQVAVLDPDDGIVKRIPYTNPKVDYYKDEHLLEFVRGMCMIDENTFLHTSCTSVLQNTGDGESGYLMAAAAESGYLMLCDAAGNVMDDSIIPGTGMNRYVTALADGKIAVLGEDSVCIYDRELNLLGQVAGSQKTTLFTSPAGELLAQGLYLGTYMRIDTEQYESSAETYYDNPKNITGIASMYFSVEESAYDVYFTNEKGFWGCDAGDAEAKLLCDWRNSGQVYNNLTILGVLDENRILISVRDPFTDTVSIGWLCSNPDMLSPKKIPIRLGIINKYGYGPQETIIENAVNHFNAHNSDYFVEIIDYSSDRDEIGEIPQAFTEAMLAGNGADVLVNTETLREAMKIYTAKQAFADLRDAFGDVLLPCVQSAYVAPNGALYSVPINMYFSMPVTLETTLPSDTALTLDVMYDLADRAEQNGAYLFTPNGTSGIGLFSDNFFAASVPSFANEETGECFYDSAEFGKLLTFLETVRERIGGEEMAFTYQYGDYSLESDVLFDALRTGKVTFLDFPFCTIDAYAILKQLYGDCDFALHGYPSRDGEIVRFHSDLDISLNAASKVKLGAAQFIAYLLSDTIQLFSADNVLPVTTSAIEALLENPTFVYDPDTMYRLDIHYSAEILELVYPEALRITYDEDDLAAVRTLLYNTETTVNIDTTVQSVINEEMSACRAGVRTLEEAQAIIQSRLWIYINE
ncbi:MAG: extracellular solute-binding protein [Clostridia bacterium]|nr:extracellular solute-binding protein [Clostridia bacterium]